MTTSVVPTSAAMAIQRLARPKRARISTMALVRSEDNVLANPRERGTTVANQPGKVAEVVTHEDDVGGLERGTAGDSAQGNADAGGGQGRCVVDAVADHAGRAVAGGQIRNRRDFVVRQEFGALLDDAQGRWPRRKRSGRCRR